MENNTTIAGSVWLSASTDFQQRVPDPSQAGIAQTSRFLFQPMNRKYLNEFMDIFVNRIAYTIVHNRVFVNPLKKKRQDLLYGTTIQEIALNFVKAHTYKDDWGNRADDIVNLLSVFKPEGRVAYHSVNREDTYPISINYVELRGAFDSEYGLNELAQAIMQVPYNSAEYDEMNIYLELFAAHERYHGFFKHQLSAAPTDDTTGKEFLKAVQYYAELFTFPSSLYNAQDVNDVPVWVNSDELSREIVVYMTPDVKASINVDTLAGIFNLDMAQIKYRIQTVPYIPIDNCVAIMTTEDFFMCADYYVGTDSFRNPQTLTETYYYHTMGVYSASPFVPAVLFTTNSGTVTPVVTQTTSAIALTPATDDVVAGGTLQLELALTGSLAIDPVTATIPEALKVAPDAATWDIVASLTTVENEGEDDEETTVTPIELDMWTYVDRLGVLHVGEGIPVDTEIVVTATATYINPSGATETLTDSATYTVVAPE